MVSTRRSQQSQLSADTVPLQQNEVDIQSKPEGGSKAVAQVQQITPRTTRSSSRLTSPAPEQPPGSVAAKRQCPPLQLTIPVFCAEEERAPTTSSLPPPATSNPVGPTPQRRSTRSQAAKGGESGTSAEGAYAAAGVSGAEGASRESALPAVTPSRG
eukprot:scaffold12754_cov17-Tisochrysis_lutea.AAC.4